MSSSTKVLSAAAGRVTPKVATPDEWVAVMPTRMKREIDDMLAKATHSVEITVGRDQFTFTREEFAAREEVVTLPQASRSYNEGRVFIPVGVELDLKSAARRIVIKRQGNAYTFTGEQISKAKIYKSIRFRWGSYDVIVAADSKVTIGCQSGKLEVLAKGRIKSCITSQFGQIPAAVKPAHDCNCHKCTINGWGNLDTLTRRAIEAYVAFYYALPKLREWVAEMNVSEPGMPDVN